MMNNNNMEWGTSGMWLGSLMMWLGLAVLVVLIVFLVRGLGGNGSSPLEVEDEALGILKDRYAAGEIDKAEFEEKRQTLFR